MDMLARRDHAPKKIRTKLETAGHTSEEIELEKARSIVDSKLGHEGWLAFDDRVKVFRWLKTRGYDSDTIRQVANEKLRNQR